VCVCVCVCVCEVLPTPPAPHSKKKVVWGQKIPPKCEILTYLWVGGV